MSLQIESSSLKRTHKSLLRSRGFMLISDVLHVPASTLASQCGVNIKTAHDILTTLTKDNDSTQGSVSLSTTGQSTQSSSASSSMSSLTVASASALSLLTTGGSLLLTPQHTVMAHSAPPLITLVQSLDELLGGGVRRGGITEVSGVPGVGKTQLAIQLALNAVLPVDVGGGGGRSLIVDCEGGVNLHRMFLMCVALCCQAIAVRNGRSTTYTELSRSSDSTVVHSDLQPHVLMSHVDIVRVLGVGQLVAVMRKIERDVDQQQQQQQQGESRRPLVYVCVDSIAFPLRSQPHDSHRVLPLLSQSMNNIKRHGVAVLVLNQVTTTTKHKTEHHSGSGSGSGSGSSGGGGFALAAALGNYWSHVPDTRLALFWYGCHRVAKVLKGGRDAEGWVDFRVDWRGVRDSHNLVDVDERVLKLLETCHTQPHSVGQPQQQEVQQQQELASNDIVKPSSKRSRHSE